MAWPGITATWATSRVSVGKVAAVMVPVSTGVAVGVAVGVTGAAVGVAVGVMGVVALLDTERQV